ncbi:hypothetical protein ONZ45_g16098 [Pleurotus djamor]|nr:hypothetical protein ONZ45_g16098 [Pleurotus djamor]
MPQVHIYYILRGDSYNGSFINSGLGGRLNTNIIQNSNSAFGPPSSPLDPLPSSQVRPDRGETFKPDPDKPHVNPSNWISRILRAFRIFWSTSKQAACHPQQYIIPISLLVGSAFLLITRPVSINASPRE